DVGGDSGVVEQVVRQLDDGIQHVVLDEITTDIGLAAARITSKQAGAVVDRGYTRAQRAGGKRFHLADHFHQEQQLSVGGTGRSVGGFLPAPVVGQFDLEARVDHFLAVLDVLDLTVPALTVGRVGEHEVEAVGGKLI